MPAPARVEAKDEKEVRVARPLTSDLWWLALDLASGPQPEEGAHNGTLISRGGCLQPTSSDPTGERHAS